MGKKTIAGCLGMLLFLAVFASGGSAEDQDKLNLNAVNAEELSQIPGLNMELAQKIIGLREDNGEFIDMEELLSVPGIDNKLLRQLKKHLFIEPVEDCDC
jgi:competence ComEA-like helix-hairpin-helix protein